MNDTQILTIALSVVVPVSFLLLGNSRVTDAKETLRAEMQTGNNRVTDAKDTLRAEILTAKADMHAFRNEIVSRLERIEDNLTRCSRITNSGLQASKAAAANRSYSTL